MELLVSSNYDNSVKEGIAVVEVGAAWCPDCQRVKPILKALEGEYPQVKFFEVDFDKEEELKDTLGIRRIPTLIFYKDGKEVGNRLVEPGNRLPIENELKAIL